MHPYLLEGFRRYFVTHSKQKNDSVSLQLIGIFGISCVLKELESLLLLKYSWLCRRLMESSEQDVMFTLLNFF